MNSTNLWASAVLVSTLCGTGVAQSTTAASRSSKASQARKHTTAHRVVRHDASEEQLRALRGEMQAQIDALKAQIAAKDQQIVTAQQSATDASADAVSASAAAQQANTAAAASTAQVEEVKTRQDEIKSNVASLQETVINNQAAVQEQINSPTVLHYKGMTITPVAFFAFEGVYRQRSVNSDINTPFNTIPFPSANEGHVSELNFTGRQSRLGALLEGNAGAYKLSGYFEADFLSAGVTSNNNQSESYTFRQRQIWGRAESKEGFGITGGQMWSLVTEDGKYTDNRTEKLPNTVDPQYMVGFSWARQPGLRLQQKFGDINHGGALTIAGALEEAQITNFTATSTAAAGIPANFFFSGTGVNGGLYNAFNGTYANNVAPDLIVKAALDLPKAHFEVGGLARFLRDYYFPILSLSAPTTAAPTGVYTYATNYVSDTKTGGGVFGSARVAASKYADIAVAAMAGDGTGRYGSAQLADATLRPDGTLEPIRNYHGLFSLETHPTKRLDVYAYYGGEYAQRTVYSTANGTLFGYGPRNLNNAGCYALPANPATSTGTTGTDTPVTCAAPTRYIQEPMIGFTYRVVNSPKYGRLQYQATYSYLQRNLWSGAVTGTVATPAPVVRTTGPRAQDNMVHVGMRYYIP